MGKGRDKQLMTKRKARVSKVVEKKGTGKNKGVGKITDATRILPKGSKHLRDRSTIKRLKMYCDRPTRNSDGFIMKERFMRRTTDKPVSRIHPDRRWFGNTKIITQKQLTLFREQMSKSVRDPYTIVLKHKKLPYGLLANDQDDQATKRMNLLSIESFSSTFNKQTSRKKPKIKSASLKSLADRAAQSADNYSEEKDADADIHRHRVLHGFEVTPGRKDLEPIFQSGESQRIKSQVYKVIDSSDVILQVLDARDPMGTRSPHIEKYLKTQCPHKHLVLILNKVDLVPTWCTQRWIKILSQEYPTIAFRAKIESSFGKGALISLLRQFRLLHKQRRTLSVGLIGYPNVGKSCIINTLVGKKSCKVAPIPGETKVWQYVSLFDKFYMIDCPGVVYPRPGDDDVTRVLRSVVRVELIEDTTGYVDAILKRVRKEYLQKTYDIEKWDTVEDFMEQIAQKRGKLLKGGEADFHIVGVMVLHDWQRGKLPWFVSPPFEDDLELQSKIIEAEEEMEKEKEKHREEGDIEEQFQPIDVIKNVTLTHDFFLDQMSVDEKHFLEDDSDDDDDDNDDDNDTRMRNNGRRNGRQKKKGKEKIQFHKLVPTTEEEKAAVLSMHVLNPLALPNDDPLMYEAKLKMWRKKRMKMKK